MESADERYPPFSHSGYGEPSYPPSAPHPGYPLTYDTFQPGFAPTGSLTDAWMFDPTYGGGPPFQWP